MTAPVLPISPGTSMPELDALVYVAFLRALSPRVEDLASGAAVDDLRAALALREDRLAAEAGEIDVASWAEPLDLRALHTRFFVLGKVAPYETSYMPSNSVGHVAELADLAGFLRAFGFEATLERTDHLLVELEFAAFLAAKEATALAEGNTEGAEIVLEARRSFYRDHFGCWVGSYAAKLTEVEPDVPYTALVDLLASWIAIDCRHLGVMPRRPTDAPAAGVYEGIDSDDAPLECMGCPADDLVEHMEDLLPPKPL